MKQMEVTIMGQSYVLACPLNGEDALHAAVRRVDQEMAAIRDSGKVKARERIAVLAALNLAYASAPTAAPGNTPPGNTPPSDTAANLAQESAAAIGELRSPQRAPETTPAEDATLSSGIEALIRRIDDRLGDDTRTA